MSKYKSKKVKYDGHNFDSVKEKNRYAELKMLEKAGMINGLALQPQFILQESFKHNGKTERAIYYIADFLYIENGQMVVEDVKGFKTPVYRLKRKMFLALYGETYLFRET